MHSNRVRFPHCVRSDLRFAPAAHAGRYAPGVGMDKKDEIIRLLLAVLIAYGLFSTSCLLFLGDKGKIIVLFFTIYGLSTALISVPLIGLPLVMLSNCFAKFKNPSFIILCVLVGVVSSHFISVLALRGTNDVVALIGSVYGAMVGCSYVYISSKLTKSA